MRILLTGNTFHGYDYDMLEALESLGHNVDILFNNIHGPYNTASNFHKKVIYGILPNKLSFNSFVNNSINNYNKYLQRLVKKNNYDFVLVIGAKTISEETISCIRCPKILWFMDGISLHPKVHAKIHLFDFTFFFEPSDSSANKEYLKGKCRPLHLGFNPRRFFPIASNYPLDFSFVGSYYPVRDELLNLIVTKDTNAEIVGDFQRSKYDSIKKLNKRRQISIDEVNKLYNRTQVNINIHFHQSVEGLNIRTLEIQGSGNLQLVEKQKLATELFTDEKNILLYDSTEMLVNKLNYYLKNKDQQNRIRKNAYEHAISHLTWAHRMQELIDTLKSVQIL